MHLFSIALSVQIYYRCLLWLTSCFFLEKTEKHSRYGKEAVKGGCISKTTIMCTERRNWEAETGNTHLSLSQKQTHIQTRAQTRWSVAIVAVWAHVSMSWLQSLASFFAEDHGGGEVTAFLDGAVSLCHFLAVCPACCACSDSGSVCVCVWRFCRVARLSRSVGHFVGAATFIRFSCLLPYFLSYLLCSLL